MVQRYSLILAMLASIVAAAVSASTAADEVRGCAAAERAAYLDQLTQAVGAAWRAPDFGVTYSCTAIVALNFRGEVLDVDVENCSRDDLVIRKSVEDAAYDASPLPLPANRSCLDRVVKLRLEHRPVDQQ